jgi:hypothetical protein
MTRRHPGQLFHRLVSNQRPRLTEDPVIGGHPAFVGNAVGLRCPDVGGET